MVQYVTHERAERIQDTGVPGVRRATKQCAVYSTKRLETVQYEACKARNAERIQIREHLSPTRNEVMCRLGTKMARNGAVRAEERGAYTRYVAPESDA